MVALIFLCLNLVASFLEPSIDCGLNERRCDKCQGYQEVVEKVKIQSHNVLDRFNLNGESLSN